ncbi:hypothetical protein ACFQY0_08305 [Haloferula chungangensis]|uniref:AsmA-like C-terminal domain-containing protein n=1 Tax=Haloferula chungangensis TaxID=1048331 RepID=A0ABW2L7W1_9BACT
MSDSDQEKYSIDEMMDRLRTRGEGSSNGEPQLVTREDGTQVMKVRKRKRRSRQPHKEAEAKQRKRSLVMAALVTVMVIALGIGALAWVFYLNSKGYREGIEAKIAEWTGAEVKTKQFRSTPVSVGAGSIELSWPEDQPAARLTLHGIQGDVKLSSYFGDELRGQQISAANGGELVLRAAAPKIEDKAGLPAGPCPFDFSYRSKKFNVKFGEGQAPAMMLSGSEASFQVPDANRAMGNLVLQGGKTRIMDWGSFDLEFASLTLSSEGVKVGNIELAPEGAPDAEVRLRGDQLPPILTRGGESELRFQLTEMPSLALFGSGLGRIIDAKFETPDHEVNTGRVFFDVTKPDSLRIDAPIHATLSSILTLHNLEFFNVLSLEVGNDRLAQARFESEARAHFKRSPSETKLEQISFVSQSLIRIEGSLSEKKGGALDGVLDVGLPDSTVLGTASRALPEVFNRRSNGHHWARIKISGTTAKPADDLAEQLRSALRGTSPASGGSSGLEDEFRDLTTPR